ncbi:MAG: ATP-binding protein [Oceanospirillaceae bacterium]|uniref:DUF2062 domain-containing protein n=1 Tax=unclassified Thalassolituus TaxID=2624967 RepID=UPI000C438110|nr:MULTISPECIES: DUF2062 domain-containing protein [unclassified Thalassolituus]MAX98648.1 ATP-binding protein [Oceanospirillaceae bacterium]MBL35474.1 ATP-binding protein [Oceanospirillaceae bacterium]MBS53486.1 ATP-binding protein [Oceanospirillaceae bacterium]|tara:strand:+ start:1027 stop:1569 length:543 start_codon:yes stop_codon:yes gene_type:complete
MPKKFLQKYFPSPEQVQSNPSLKLLAPLFAKPNLFHVNRHSVSRAFLVGLFCAFLPLPFQMGIAALMAFYANANMPMSIGLVWITNPFTMAPIFYATYRFGTWLLNTPPNPFSIELSVQWVLSELGNIWQPLFAGSMVSGVICGVGGYIAIQIIWRRHVVQNWERRRISRLKRKAEEEEY